MPPATQPQPHDFITFPSRRVLNFENPSPASIELLDIANALSHVARWSGHTRSAFSVAQHSVLVSKVLPDDLKAVGLLHDATEAYMQDVPTPLKRLLPRYLEIENRLWQAIAARFGVDHEQINDPRLKAADRLILGLEHRVQRGDAPYTPTGITGCVDKDFHAWISSFARQQFLAMAHTSIPSLCGERASAVVA